MKEDRQQQFLLKKVDELELAWAVLREADTAQEKSAAMYGLSIAIGSVLGAADFFRINNKQEGVCTPATPLMH